MSNKYGIVRRFSRNKRFALISPGKETRIYSPAHCRAREGGKESVSAGNACTYRVVAAVADAGVCPPQTRKRGRGSASSWGSRQRVRSGCGSGSCDCFGFDLGSIYRVYARMRAPSLLSTTLLDATLRLERNQPREHIRTHVHINARTGTRAKTHHVQSRTSTRTYRTYTNGLM